MLLRLSSHAGHKSEDLLDGGGNLKEQGGGVEHLQRVLFFVSKLQLRCAHPPWKHLGRAGDHDSSAARAMPARWRLPSNSVNDSTGGRAHASGTATLT
uniref:Uncharacterized protein n=1 Tax=Leersia perrieri TaxID=77586 RepID=A0A0D9VTF4_9ORYZ